MKIIKDIAFDYYTSDNYNPKEVNYDKSGKWMYFFEVDQLKRVSELCKSAIEDNVVSICKHSNKHGCSFSPFGNGQSGVTCFYVEYDDTEAHKKVITFLLENNLIKRTKAGKLFNISFKFDEQTKKGEYDNKFKAKITLDNFIDLFTGEWK